jgi:hypothetical protein
MLACFLQTLCHTHEHKSIENNEEDEREEIDENNIDTSNSVFIVLPPNSTIDAQQYGAPMARRRGDSLTSCEARCLDCTRWDEWRSTEAYPGRRCEYVFNESPVEFGHWDSDNECPAGNAGEQKERSNERCE